MAGTELERVQPISPIELIQSALASGTSPEVIRELVALQQSMERFNWEREERQAEQEFGDALTECQRQIGRVAPNVKRSDTNSWWADYAQLDRVVRPIYTSAGFAISFSEVAPINPAKVRIKATLKRGRIEREYFSEITPSTEGPKGGKMATATDADAIAQSRAKRYLIIDIFNISVGIDAVEKQGIPDEEFGSWLDKIGISQDMEELNRVSLAAIKAVHGETQLVQRIGQAKNQRIKEFRESTHA